MVFEVTRTIPEGSTGSSASRQLANTMPRSVHDETDSGRTTYRVGY